MSGSPPIVGKGGPDLSPVFPDLALPQKTLDAMFAGVSEARVREIVREEIGELRVNPSDLTGRFPTDLAPSSRKLPHAQ